MSTNNTKALKKHITLLCIIFTVIVPLVNNFALSLVLSNIYGDIMYSTVSAFLETFVTALDTLNMFLIFAVLVNNLVRFGLNGSKNIITLCFVRIVIVYASYIAIGAIVTTNFVLTLKGNLIYCLTNSIIDIMLLAGTVILCCFLRSKYLGENNTDITIRKIFDKKNPLTNIIMWTTALISAFLLSGCIINTITDISAYGTDNLNLTELIYLTSPYAVWLFKTLFGYLVMIFTAKWIELIWKNINSAPKDTVKSK